MVYYQSGKANVEADALSRIPGDQSITAEVVEAIFKAAVIVHDALIEIYVYHEKAIRCLILKSLPVWMTAADWVRAQKADPTITQVVTWMENKKLETMKVDEQMSYKLKQYLRQRGKPC